MSVRAHRVEEIRTNGTSFNLWHDVDVTEWLKNNTSFFSYLDHDCCGLSFIEVEELESMLSEIGERMEDSVRESIQEDIKFAKVMGEQYVKYLCY